ncbi:kinesin-like protein Nod [Ctenocephalides felis]|uniref:kinesin-like protein Nod n=1 Tax=Ctenocephalides felis TaxID=7515 RepID=UPI000E6E508D|nr:kinesin-like protein Nod [Ctenocephalides felis]
MTENWPKVHTFRVAIRVRPFLKHETGNVPAIRFLPNDPQMLVADDKPFVFDHIYNEESQENFYASLIYPMVTKLLEGYHCTIMAYGHTGTGKTHTMGSGINAEDGVNAGLLQRSLNDIFLRAAQNSVYFSISISGIEIYNDKAYDLLGDAERPLKVARMCSASSHLVRSPNEAVQYFRKGILARHTRSTKLNQQSSRSHALFTVNCNIKNGNHETNACLHLVDLAGTEGVRETGHEGAAFTEGIKINQSLLGLHLLLRNLAKSENTVSYRESVLTTLLQDALNSNNYVTLIGCISPSMEHIKRTITTLEFVSGAKSVRSKPLLQLQYNEYKKENKCDGDHTKDDTMFLVPKTPKFKRPPFGKHTPTLNQARTIGKTTAVSKSCTESPMPTRKPFTPIQKNNTFSTPQKIYQKTTKFNSTTDCTPTRIKQISSTPAARMEMVTPKQTPIPLDYSGFITDMSRISTSSHASAFGNSKTYSPEIEILRENMHAIMSRLEGLEKQNKENVKKDKTDITLTAMENVTDLESCSLDNTLLQSTILENPVKSNKKVRRSIRIQHKKNMTVLNNKMNQTRMISVASVQGNKTIGVPHHPVPSNNAHLTINLTMDKMGNPVILDAYGVPNRNNVYKSKSKEHLKKLRHSLSKNSQPVTKLLLHTLNTSSAKDMQVLETVGPVTAQLIVEHRERIGKFRCLQELKDIPFWKQKSFERFLSAYNL